ncbi:hypothetical protein LTS08_000825 [Lithohypha guttulata]|nr:hypothetical protein LTS08_000825 [Lithohypha guttulata]
MVDNVGGAVQGIGENIEAIGGFVEDGIVKKRGMVDGTFDAGKQVSDGSIDVAIGLFDGAEQTTDNVGDVVQGVGDDLEALGGNVGGLLFTKRSVVTALLLNAAGQLVDSAGDVVDTLGSDLGNNAAAKRALTLPADINLKDILEEAGDTTDDACSIVEGVLEGIGEVLPKDCGLL